MGVLGMGITSWGRSSFWVLLAILSTAAEGWARSAVEEQLLNFRLPIGVVGRHIGIPRAKNAEGAPIENVVDYHFPAVLRFEVPGTKNSAGHYHVRPYTSFDLGGGEERLNFAWGTEEGILAYFKRFPTAEQVALLRMEDGTWAITLHQQLMVDRSREKLYVRYDVVEFQSSQHIAGVDIVHLEVPLEEIPDRVFTAPAIETLPQNWRAQRYYVNFTPGLAIPVTVIGFEPAHSEEFNKGPLTRFLPGFENKAHSALVVFDAELVDPEIQWVRLLRVPVKALRRASHAGEAIQSPLTNASFQRWLEIFTLRDLAVTCESAEARYQTVKAQVENQYVVARSFNLKSEGACVTALAATPPPTPES